jgi:hypothetical protein
MDAKTRWDYFSKVVKVEDISITSGKLDFGRFDQGDVWVAIIFFLFNDMLGALCRSLALWSTAQRQHTPSRGLAGPSPQGRTGVLVAGAQLLSCILLPERSHTQACDTRLVNSQRRNSRT